MDDSTATAPATPAKGKKATKPKGPRKPKAPASHPKYLDMVVAAVKGLKERQGSSRQAILKYINSHYNVGKDGKTVNTHLKMALKRGEATGVLKHSKGQGASGSFRLSASKQADSTEKKTPVKKTGASKPRKPAAKSAKKPAAKKAKPAKQSKAEDTAAATPKKRAAPKKAKAAKSPKPKKTPKPKKAKAPKPKKAKSPKKAVKAGGRKGKK